MDYLDLCRVYQELESTSKRLDKTHTVSAFLRRIKPENVESVTLLLQGIVFPLWDDRKLGFSSSYVLKALSLTLGLSVDAIKEVWRETGDLGMCAEKLIKKKKQTTLFTQKLTVDKVFSNIKKLAEIKGQKSVEIKVGLICELLSSASSIEARFIVRTVLDELRIGLGAGTLRDALIWAYLPQIFGISAQQKDDEVPEKTLVVHSVNDVKGVDLLSYNYILAESNTIAREIYNWFLLLVSHALDLCSDFSKVAHLLRLQGLAGLSDIKLTIGVPISAMLAQKEDTIENAFKRVGVPCAIEYKLDGFRLQIHKKGNEVSLFTRRLENVTTQFPDVVLAVRNLPDVILDVEVVGLKEDGTFAPFQYISQRIKRKYDIDHMIKQVPVQIHVFDCMFYDHQSLLSESFEKRRAVVEKLIQANEKILPVLQLCTEDVAKAQSFYEKSLAAGAEGIMFKSLHALYKPGNRVGTMVKMKPTMETLDLVVVGAEWGEGKRSAWLSSFTLACRDGDSLREIGRVSTGLKEKREEGLSFEEMTQLLRPLIDKQHGKLVVVKPEVVLEIKYEEIQRSAQYQSGFALRFPRVSRLRFDRDAKNCSTLQDVERLFNS